jgi:hypothetical protein
MGEILLYAFFSMRQGQVTKDSQDGALQGHAAAVTHITINERSSQIISLSADKVIKVLRSSLSHVPADWLAVAPNMPFLSFACCMSNARACAFSIVQDAPPMLC